VRCPWAESSPLYRDYHDEEWGRPLHGRDALFERICLEAFQSGLSWITILRKRPAFRAAFADFDAETVAAFGDADTGGCCDSRRGAGGSIPLALFVLGMLGRRRRKG